MTGLQFLLPLLLFIGLGSLADQSDIELVKGLKLAQQEHYAEAVEVFRRVLSRDPANTEARYNLALALLALGRAEEGLTTLQGWRGANTVPFRYLRGKLEAAAGQDEQAEKDLAFAAETDPRQEMYQLDLGMLYIRRQNFTNALSSLKRGIQYHPDSPYMLLSLALAQSFAGNTQEATGTAQRILELHPNFAPARLVIAHAFYMNADYARSEKEASAAIASGDSNPYLYYLRASSRFKLNSTDWNGMLSDLDSAQKTVPDCPICWLLRSKVHQSEGNLTAAISDLEQVVRTTPDFGQAWSRLSLLYQRAGRAGDAAKARDMYRNLRTKQETDAEKKLAERSLLGDVRQ